MVKTYKINAQSHLFFIKKLLIGATVFWLVYTFYIRYHPDEDWIIARVMIGGYLIMALIPCAIVHTEYFMYNRDLTLVIDKFNKVMTISYGDSTHRINFAEIKRVQVSMTANPYNGQTWTLLPQELYQYATIMTENGERFIITRLLINDLIPFFRDLGLFVTKKRVFFPFIWEDRYEKIDEVKHDIG